MKTTAKIISACALLLLTVLTTTQPGRLPSVILIIPFLLLFVILSLTIALMVGLLRGGVTARSVRIGCAGAVLPVLLLVLQSVGQLTVRDALTLFALFAITYFYMAKVNAIRT